MKKLIKTSFHHMVKHKNKKTRGMKNHENTTKNIKQQHQKKIPQQQ